jgi:hypothetical protein
MECSGSWALMGHQINLIYQLRISLQYPSHIGESFIPDISRFMIPGMILILSLESPSLQASGLTIALIALSYPLRWLSTKLGVLMGIISIFFASLPVLLL